MPTPEASTSIATEVEGRRLGLTNLDKALFATGFTKAEVVDYYLRIAPVMLPHLAGRCITRRRFPEGADGDSFYEKNVPGATPDWVQRQRVDAASVPVDYPLADSPATLVWLANLAALELHTPQWRIDGLVGGPLGPSTPIPLDAPDLVRSDRLVVDLDPGPGMRMADSCRAAMLVATELAHRGLIPFVKTSGNKGLQVFAPIEPTAWQQVVDEAKALAQLLASRHPDTFVAVMAREQRTNRIFVDYLQNQAARNTIAPWSLRARPVESVSTPVSWDEVAAVQGDGPLAFTAGQVLERVAAQQDPWAEMLDPGCRAPLPHFG